MSTTSQLLLWISATGRSTTGAVLANQSPERERERASQGSSTNTEAM